MHPPYPDDSVAREAYLRPYRRRRHQLIAGVVTAVLGLFLIGRAVLDDRGWSALFWGLLVIAAGVIIAGTCAGARRGLRVIGSVLAASLIVTVGLVAVRLEPWGAQGWAAEHGEMLIGHGDGLAVTTSGDALRGRDASSGEILWETAGVLAGPGEHAIVDRGQLIVMPTVGGESGRALSVLDPATGELQWTEPIGSTHVVALSDEVVVLARHPSAGLDGYGVADLDLQSGLHAVDRSDGSQRWQRSEWPLPPQHAPLDHLRFDALIGTSAMLLATPTPQQGHPVLDLGSGDVAGTLTAPENGLRHVVVADTIVTYEPGGTTTVTAHDADGEVRWQAAVQVGGIELVDGVAAGIRVVGEDGIATLDHQRGQGEVAPWPGDLARFLAFDASPGYDWVIPADVTDLPNQILQTTTGDVIDLDDVQRGAWGARILGRSHADDRVFGSGQADRAVVELRVRDAVGTGHFGYARLTPQGMGPVLISQNEARVVDGMVQLEDRMVLLEGP